MKFSKNFLTIFEEREDTESHLIQLSKLYPKILVEPILYDDMQSLLSDGKKEASYIFRKLIQVLIPETTAWAQCNGAKDMVETYSSEIGAAYEFVKAGRQYFDYKKRNSLLCQIIAEQRRTLRNKLEATLSVSSSDEDQVGQSQGHAVPRNNRDVPNEDRDTSVESTGQHQVSVQEIEEEEEEEVVIRAPRKTLRNMSFTSEDLRLSDEE